MIPFSLTLVHLQGQQLSTIFFVSSRDDLPESSETSIAPADFKPAIWSSTSRAHDTPRSSHFEARSSHALTQLVELEDSPASKCVCELGRYHLNPQIAGIGLKNELLPLAWSGTMEQARLCLIGMI